MRRWLSIDWKGFGRTQPLPTPLGIAPKGTAWPWLPIYRGEAWFTPNPETLSFDLKGSGPLVKGRVGLKVWAKNLPRTISNAIRPAPPDPPEST